MYAVPKTVINDVGEVVGAVPEAHLVAAITDVVRAHAPAPGEAERPSG